MTKDVNGTRFVTWRGFLFAILMITGSFGALSGYVLHTVTYEKPAGMLLSAKVDQMQGEITDIKILIKAQAVAVEELHIHDMQILTVLDQLQGIQGIQGIKQPLSKRHTPP